MEFVLGENSSSSSATSEYFGLLFFFFTIQIIPPTNANRTTQPTITTITIIIQWFVDVVTKQILVNWQLSKRTADTPPFEGLKIPLPVPVP